MQTIPLCQESNSEEWGACNKKTENRLFFFFDKNNYFPANFG